MMERGGGGGGEAGQNKMDGGGGEDWWGGAEGSGGERQVAEGGDGPGGALTLALCRAKDEASAEEEGMQGCRCGSIG